MHRLIVPASTARHHEIRPRHDKVYAGTVRCPRQKISDTVSQSIKAWINFQAGSGNKIWIGTGSHKDGKLVSFRTKMVLTGHDGRNQKKDVTGDFVGDQWFGKEFIVMGAHWANGAYVSNTVRAGISPWVKAGTSRVRSHYVGTNDAGGDRDYNDAHFSFEEMETRPY